MPSGFVNNALARAARRVPGLKNLPIMQLLSAAEIAVLAKDHLDRLEPHERRRIIELLRTGRGRPSTLTATDREELASLVAKAEPRMFLGEAVEKLSPIPLPKRIAYGRGPRPPAA